ncbi:MAG TPA: Na+/H+ antiporter NhaC family protein, partial [Candidatus Babeliales bacterium]|nr:Na+/H+ antiporter NhaC family protein [Candidatus Babeliales bacterium]
LLVVGVVVGILYAGNYYAFGGNNSFIDAFRENHKTFLVLFTSATLAFITSLCISLCKKMITLRALPMIIYEGVALMYSSIIMVALASILGSFLRMELHTGSYIASLLSGTTPLFLIPVMLFLISLLITLMTGSAWGTFSLLIPITTQMLISFLQLNPPVMLDQIPILFPSLGAVLSGAACGNHISPIADTTIMTATSTGIEPLKHAKSQFYYVVPVIIATILSFVLAGIFCGNGLTQGLFVPLGAGCAVMIACFVILNYLKKGH